MLLHSAPTAAHIRVPRWTVRCDGCGDEYDISGWRSRVSRHRFCARCAANNRYARILESWRRTLVHALPLILMEHESNGVAQNGHENWEEPRSAVSDYRAAREALEARRVQLHKELDEIIRVLGGDPKVRKARAPKAAKPAAAKPVRAPTKAKKSPVHPDALDSQVLGYLGTVAQAKISSLKENVSQSPAQLRTTLKRLLESGAITKTGEKRGTSYAVA